MMLQHETKSQFSKTNWRQNPTLLVRLLFISLLLNGLIVIFFIGKRIYYSNSSFFKKTTNQKTNIVILGDSRASGGKWKKGLERNDIRNCGIGGLHTSELLKKLDTAYELHPRTCIIQIGINDIRSNTSNNVIEKNYEEIIDSLLYYHIKPVVTSIIPLRKDYWSDLLPETVVNLRADSLNNKLAHLCEDKNIPYIDINKNIAEGNRLKRDYTWDGIHLNDSGYYWVCQEIKSFLNAE